MVKITLNNKGKKVSLLVPEQKPIKDVLKELEVDVTPFDSVTLHGKKLSPDDLDKNILDLGLGDQTDMDLVIADDVPWVTDDNPAAGGSVVYPPKAKIIGCACIIASAFTVDELRDFQRYMPEALTKRDEKGEPIFAISLDETSPGSLNKYGATFSRKATKAGNATITNLLDPECDDMEDMVRDQLGSAILRLVDMEEYLMKKFSELHGRKEMLDLHISVT